MITSRLESLTQNLKKKQSDISKGTKVCPYFNKPENFENRERKGIPGAGTEFSSLIMKTTAGLKITGRSFSQTNEVNMDFR